LKGGQERKQKTASFEKEVAIRLFSSFLSEKPQEERRTSPCAAFSLIGTDQGKNAKKRPQYTRLPYFCVSGVSKEGKDKKSSYRLFEGAFSAILPDILHGGRIFRKNY